MKWQSRFRGEHISAAELGDRRPTFTIAKVGSIKVDDEKKKREVEKPVIWFKEIDRSWMYNKTAGHCLAHMFGADDDAWVGKRITLFSDENVYFGSDQVGGIRIAGSPDIAKQMTVRIKFPKKRPLEITLEQTAAPKPQQKKSDSAPVAPPIT